MKSGRATFEWGTSGLMREKNVNRVWEGWEDVRKRGGLRNAKRRRNDVLTYHKDIAANRGAAVTAVLNAGVICVVV